MSPSALLRRLKLLTLPCLVLRLMVVPFVLISLPPVPRDPREVAVAVDAVADVEALTVEDVEVVVAVVVADEEASSVEDVEADEVVAVAEGKFSNPSVNTTN
jgi:hypothetical protein